MGVYIGMDISLQQTHVCVVDNEGKIMREGGVVSEIPAIADWLGRQGSAWDIKRIVFETGQLSTHFYHGLKALGFAVVCADYRPPNQRNQGVCQER